MSEEIGATLEVHTTERLPRTRRAIARVKAKQGLPSASPLQQEATAAVATVVVTPPAASVGEGQKETEPQGLAALSDTILLLKQLQRTRRFCIVSQSRIDRSTEAFIALQWGLDRDAPDAERKKAWTKITTFRKGVERDADGLSRSANHVPVASRVADGGGHASVDGQPPGASSICTPVILAAMQSRAPWDKVRNDAEREMRRLAHTLPAWSFVEPIKGLSDLGLAVIIAETGDLSNYATKERVWKRLGLAVIEGERQRRVGGEAAAAHGYSPLRRAEIWSLCSDSMFRQQWRGEKDGVPAHAIGRYGEIYAARKAHTETRGWTAAHRDNDARRIMTKSLVEDLHRAWRRATQPVETRHHMPASSSTNDVMRGDS